MAKNLHYSGYHQKEAEKPTDRIDTMNIENAKDGITENSFQVNLTAQVLNTEDILDVSKLDKFLEGTELTHNFVPGKISYMWRGERGSTPITSGGKYPYHIWREAPLSHLVGKSLRVVL